MTTSFQNFSELTVRLNRLNKSFMDNLEYDLDIKGIDDINITQALMIKNIGNSKANITNITNHGYFIGTNITYNVNLLLQKGYLVKDMDTADNRCVYLSLTKKGLAILKIINSSMLSQKDALTNVGVKDIFIQNIISIIDKLQRVLQANVRI